MIHFIDTNGETITSWKTVFFVEVGHFVILNGKTYEIIGRCTPPVGKGFNAYDEFFTVWLD